MAGNEYAAKASIMRVRFVVGIFVVLAISITCLSAQQASPALPSRESATLLPVGKAILDAAVVAEKRQPGLWRSPTFPLPMCGFAGGLCGAVNRDGTIAVAPAFDWVDEFHEDRAIVRSGGLYGYVDTAGRIIAQPQYKIAGRFEQGLAQVDVDGRSGLIDAEGRVVLEARFGFVVPAGGDAFWVSEGRTTSAGPPGTEKFNFGNPVTVVNGYSDRHVGPSGKWGLIDRSGSWIRPPEFDAVSYFDKSNSKQMRVMTSQGWGVMISDGTWHIEPKFQVLGQFQLYSGLAGVRVDGRWGAIDRSGQIVIAPKFELPIGFGATATLAVMRSDNRYGLIDRAGAWIVEPQYDRLHGGGILIPNDWWSVVKDSKYGLLDERGKLVIGPQFDQAPRLCNGGYIVGVIDKKPRIFTREGAPVNPPEGEMVWPASCDTPHIVKVGDKFGYADENLRPITSAQFDYAGIFRDGIATAKLNGRSGLIRPDGTWLIEPSFDAIALGTDNIALAQMDGKSGMIDVATGEWKVAPQFDSICPLAHGLTMAVVNQKKGILARTGQWLIEPKFSRLGIRLEDGLLAVLVDDKWGLVDVSGSLVIDAKYDQGVAFDRGIAWAKTGEAWCPIDRKGNAISGLPCQQPDPTRGPFRTFDCRIR